jgi:hypothetical protein
MKKHCCAVSPLGRATAEPAPVPKTAAAAAKPIKARLKLAIVFIP